MPRMMPPTLTQGGMPMHGPEAVVAEEISPLIAARTLCETVRDEHGRKGVGAFLESAAPFLPAELVAETAALFHVTVRSLPPAEGERPPQKESPPIPPELLMQLLSGSSGGLDPMLLLKMLQK